MLTIMPPMRSSIKSGREKVIYALLICTLQNKLISQLWLTYLVYISKKWIQSHYGGHMLYVSLETDLLKKTFIFNTLATIKKLPIS
jgi:hypothetical protein